MKKPLPVLIAVVILFMYTGLSAGEISIYKDKEGVINLTDKPAPSGARVQDVVRYKEKSAAELEQQQQLGDQNMREFRQQQEIQKAQKLRDDAEKASKQAEEESALAREKIKAAEDYLERYNQKRRSQRRRHRKTAQRVANEAQEAQVRANAAITRANQAQKAASEASAKASGSKE